MALVTRQVSQPQGAPISRLAGETPLVLTRQPSQGALSAGGPSIVSRQPSYAPAAQVRSASAAGSYAPAVQARSVSAVGSYAPAAQGTSASAASSYASARSASAAGRVGPSSAPAGIRQPLAVSPRRMSGSGLAVGSPRGASPTAAMFAPAMLAGVPGLAASPRGSRSSLAAAPPPMRAISAANAAETAGLTRRPSAAESMAQWTPSLAATAAFQLVRSPSDGRLSSLASQRSSSTTSLAQVLGGNDSRASTLQFGVARASIVSTSSGTQNIGVSMAPSRVVSGAAISLGTANFGVRAAPARTSSRSFSSESPQAVEAGTAPSFSSTVAATRASAVANEAESAVAIVAADSNSSRGPSHADVLAIKPMRPKRQSLPTAARSERLYKDAVTRRQRQQDLKEVAEKAQQDYLEECKRDALLEQRERQRFYHFRDKRTHEEREDALIARREERTKLSGDEQRRLEQLEYSECTFQPRIFTRREEREAFENSLRTDSPPRASSCSAVARQSPEEGRASIESPRVPKLHKLLSDQQALIQKCAEINEETEQALANRKDPNHAEAEQQREVEVQLYKANLEVVHSLDRLDMQVLDMPQASLDALLTMGYRLGLGEKGRRGLISPREASRKAIAETPRNNLRGSYVDSPEEEEEAVEEGDYDDAIEVTEEREVISYAV